MCISFKEKIAQMLMVGFDGYTVSDNQNIVRAVSEYGLGGVILYDLQTDNYRLRNIKSPGQVKKLTNDLKFLSDSELLVGIDHEGGQVNRLKEEYGFPKTYSHKYLGDLNDLLFTYRESLLMAETLGEIGVNVNFAPVIDINLNPCNPVIAAKERSFSSSPQTVTAHAREFIKAHEEYGIITVVKHFPGHGSSSADSHLDMVDITESWKESELWPYNSLLRDDLISCVMTAHVFNRRFDPEYPATLSRSIIDEILRKQMGFDGVVFSDDLSMNAIKSHYGIEAALEKAINAGVDILLISYSERWGNDVVGQFTGLIMELLDKGSISEFRIHESYRRITNLKKRLTDL